MNTESCLSTNDMMMVASLYHVVMKDIITYYINVSWDKREIKELCTISLVWGKCHISVVYLSTVTALPS